MPAGALGGSWQMGSPQQCTATLWRTLPAQRSPQALWRGPGSRSEPQKGVPTRWERTLFGAFAGAKGARASGQKWGQGWGIERAAANATPGLRPSPNTRLHTSPVVRSVAAFSALSWKQWGVSVPQPAATDNGLACPPLTSQQLKPCAVVPRFAPLPRRHPHLHPHARRPHGA